MWSRARTSFAIRQIVAACAIGALVAASVGALAHTHEVDQAEHCSECQLHPGTPAVLAPAEVTADQSRSSGPLAAPELAPRSAHRNDHLIRGPPLLLS